MKGVKGVKMPRGHKDSIRAYPLLVPTKDEQQKIASCLSSLDELIAAHSDKLQALKDHKKGLMQNLFPQEGQKVPNYRFPEFENDGEWKEKTIKQIAKVTTGNKDTQNKINDGKYPFFVRSQTFTPR
jgi:type I restriction enzyme S subunit